jgi:hypothetical protein
MPERKPFKIVMDVILIATRADGEIIGCKRPKKDERTMTVVIEMHEQSPHARTSVWYAKHAYKKPIITTGLNNSVVTIILPHLGLMGMDIEIITNFPVHGFKPETKALASELSKLIRKTRKRFPVRLI